MCLSHLFSLNGFAYLENIFFDESKCIAQFKSKSYSHEDQVYLECEIQGELEEYLFGLLEDVKRGQSVIVLYDAVYLQFRVAFSGRASESETSSQQIVRLRCKLLRIRESYINGCRVDKSSRIPPAVCNNIFLKPLGILEIEEAIFAAEMADKNRFRSLVAA